MVKHHTLAKKQGKGLSFNAGDRKVPQVHAGRHSLSPVIESIVSDAV